MRPTLAALSLAAGTVLACSQGAGATPLNASSLNQTAAHVSPVQQIQYRERHRHHGIVKCYRDFVVGPYRCHYYHYHRL